MKKAPESLRIHIGFFGQRNVGKSSLLNALANQEISIVSDTPGTTTDPVKKAMELIPLGPVLFIDTAGLDDVGNLGAERVRRSESVLRSVDAAIVVTTESVFGNYEQELLDDLGQRKIPTIIAVNKSDEDYPSAKFLEKLPRVNRPVIVTSVKDDRGISDLKTALVRSLPEKLQAELPIIADLMSPGDVVVFVTPIDAEAPKGRIIMPQVQALRDALDNNFISMVVQEDELEGALKVLNTPPALVITDSQAFEAVASIVPENVPLTSFSIIFSRFKGDLDVFARGAQQLNSLTPESSVLIAEACTHNPVEGDIGREKIPRWLREKIGDDLTFDFVKGRDFHNAENLKKYDLIIHCGGCTLNRKGLLSRLDEAEVAVVPITNYGLVIAWVHGILDRVVAPFSAQPIS